MSAATGPGWRRARSAVRARVLRRQGLRGRVPLPRLARRAVVGRQHVRGADGRPVRPRSRSGRRTAGASTTRSPFARRSSTACVDAEYGYWGFSPANIPEGGYAVYGVDAIGLDPNGNPSNEDRTLVDHGYAGCPTAPRNPSPRPRPTRTASSRRTRRSWRCATRPGGAREPPPARADPAHVRPLGLPRQRQRRRTKRVSDFYLSLDQGMVMGALGNDSATTCCGRRSPTSSSKARCAR